MTSQPIEANVVLTADNSGYDQAMAGSASSTESLMNSVDKLTAKIGKLTKTAGKSLIGIAAADVAMITAATAAWSSYEKQMERLKAQSAVLTRSNTEQEKVMKDYTATVKGLRSEMGVTTNEAAKLTETLSKITSIKQTRELGALSEIFVKMSKTTGESSSGLASSLGNLQKIMGAPINERTTKKYADTITYLSAQTNTSAEGLTNFAAQLAPVAKSLGMNTEQVLGFSTAFTKAGQDTGAASLAFTKITSDLLRSVQTGSPELATYANMIGMTDNALRKMVTRGGGKDSAEAVVQIMESMSKNGQLALNDLNRLGLDAPRTLRSLTAMTNEPGGLRASMGQATSPAAEGAVDRGYEATLKGLSNQFEEIREDLKQTAEAFATILGPAMEAFLWGIEKMASVMQEIVQGPVGKFMQMVVGFVAPLAAGAGALLLFAGALIKVAAAFALLRNSATRGLVEGFRGGAGITRSRDGVYGARGGGDLGATGRNLVMGATGPDESGRRSTWIQRGLYNVGQFGGSGLAAFRPGGEVPQNWYAAREAVSSRMPWTQQYVRPETPRSALNMLSRGAGYAISNFVTPQFDQMRHAGPSQRTTWAHQEAPWIRGGETMSQYGARVPLIGGMARAMGRVALADTQLAGQRAETVRVHQDPLMTEDARQARLQELRTMREETIARRNGALAQERSFRQEIGARGEATRITQQAGQETKTFGQAMRGLARNVAGGVAGGVAAGGRAAWERGMVGQAGAMGAMVAGGTMGSQALMMGGVGAMMGGMMLPGLGTAVGALAGGGIGLAMDAAKANNDVEESIKTLDQQATDASKNGGGLVMLRDQTKQSGEDLDKMKESFSFKSWLTSTDVSDSLGAVKNVFEGLGPGSSDVEEAQRSLDKTREKAQDTQDAFRGLAEYGGVELTGSKTNQLQQIEQFMATRGTAALGKADIEVEDLVKAQAKGGAEYEAMLAKALVPGEAGGTANDRLRGEAAGAAMLDSKTAQRSLRLQGDVDLFYDATNEIFTNMREQGMSYLDILESTEKTQQRIGDEGDRRYVMQMALSQKAQYALSMQAPQIGRAATFEQSLQIGTTLMGIRPKTEEQATQLEQQKQQTVQSIADNDAYFRQLLLAQQAYERSRQRAQEDYHLQRQYQEYDYNLQRTRAEESFNRMRGRAVAEYHRSVTHAWFDFNLQRKRQEEDYQHQVDVTAQQQATGMNLYARRETQRTSSATWLMSNTEDILGKLREQKQNLNRLRDLGFSDDVIQQLQLTDPNNAQQLARFVHEVEADRSMAGKFNKTARKMKGATADLFTDESSLDFQEMQRSFQLGRERGMDDMQRSMKRQRNAFNRGLSQQRDDFNLMMDQQAEDYETQTNRQRKGYKQSMDRAAEDMSHMADEVLGSITHVMVQAQKKLTGSAKEQATLALQSFKDLRNDTRPEAVAMMRELSEVFGFDYKNPLKTGGKNGIVPSIGTSSSYTPQPTPSGAENVAGRAQGGVVPGWSPGRDVVQVNLSGGEAIMRPEWARAIGEKNIAVMNHRAKHGGFAEGGVFWPVPGHDTSTYPGHDGADINRGSGSDDLGDPIRAFRKGTITYVGTGHGYGEAIFEKTAAGTVVYGHTSSQSVHAGQQVSAGQLIGQVGSTGNSSAPHLHFGIPGGTYAQALALLAGAIVGGGGFAGFAGGGGTGIDPMTLLKDSYPKAEKSAASMSGVSPLKPGMISSIINRFARRKIRELQSGVFGGQMAAMADSNLGREPNESMTNEQLVHVGANRYGWGAQWPQLRELVMHESGFNNTAQNPNSTAYGMFQFLDGTWAGVGGTKTSDPWKQTQYGLRYIKNRYDDPRGAWDFWQQHNWYKDGAVINGAQTIGVGEDGPEAVIPLNDRGANFMADVMGSVMGGRNVQASGRGWSIHNYRIDRSTNFTGPITVQANDPNELLSKLQARQRVRALTRPSVSGSAA